MNFNQTIAIVMGEWDHAPLMVIARKKRVVFTHVKLQGKTLEQLKHTLD